MSITSPVTGPQRGLLDKALAQLKQLDDDLWLAGEIGMNPVYANYGIPDNCSEAMAFMLMDSYVTEIKRKKEMLMLVQGFGIEGAMQRLLESV